MPHKCSLALVAAVAAASVRGQGAVWSQCESVAVGWTGATTCVDGAVCTAQNDYYSQCVPGTATTTASTTVTSASKTTTTGPSNTAAPGAGTLKFVGVNIAGFDFGCNTDGSCTASAAYPPLTQYYGKDGKGQMTHFVNDDGYNVFRLPVGWQFLTNNVIGPVNQTNLVEYDALVQTCLATGAYCIIDIHNYARWNKAIIGQGGPTNAQFAQTWSEIATFYKDTQKVIFGVMNEPHDIPDINLWAGSVQAAVTAIRNAGATTQMILLPGNDYTSAGTFISNGSGDGNECTTNNIDGAWAPLVQWLRANNRQAFNTETGGGNTASCVQYMCQQIAYQAQNSDVILGYVGWSAGNFDASYVLSELPSGSGSSWTDTELVAQCMAPKAGAQNGSTS
ncbi:glycoside hydrolase superfamily [Favolaschia claudopus]|uniref:cellulase n=1 Tax=Favolaschia claudopus TaxID=2862362 RepID=A0AAV9YY98_9AGAR